MERDRLQRIVEKCITAANECDVAGLGFTLLSCAGVTAEYGYTVTSERKLWARAGRVIIKVEKNGENLVVMDCVQGGEKVQDIGAFVTIYMDDYRVPYGLAMTPLTTSVFSEDGEIGPRCEGTLSNIAPEGIIRELEEMKIHQHKPHKKLRRVKNEEVVANQARAHAAQTRHLQNFQSVVNRCATASSAGELCGLAFALLTSAGIDVNNNYCVNIIHGPDFEERVRVEVRLNGHKNVVVIELLASTSQTMGASEKLQAYMKDKGFSNGVMIQPLRTLIISDEHQLKALNNLIDFEDIINTMAQMRIPEFEVCGEERNVAS